MKEVIDLFRNVVIQIATPYSTGTGFVLRDYKLIITNEHLVRDNAEVLVSGETFDKQLVPVLFIDARLDLAFLQAPDLNGIPHVALGNSDQLHHGDPILVLGHPFGLKYASTRGIISSTTHEQNGTTYFQHDAALNPGNSGGPLISQDGQIMGVNTFVIRDGENIGFSLPANYLKATLDAYQSHHGSIGVRCVSCANLVFTDTVDKGYCPFCGSKIGLPNEVEPYEPIGVPKTIEDMLENLGQEVRLSRRGPNNWEIIEGSARISISYYEKTGLITGDAYLCTIPQDNIQPVYEYLLRQNYLMEGLTFSIKGQDMILSVLIYDRYLNVDSGAKLFRHLFDQADYHDNILVEEYGASWKYEDTADP